MGNRVPSITDFERSWSARGVTSKEKVRVTAAAEQQAHHTHKLSPVVDPAHDPIRRSLMRFDPITLPDGCRAWTVTVGVPMPIESCIDTTGSMGNNVDLTSEHLPESFGMLQQVLPGYDIQYAPGYFGDVSDKFPFQRGQFEMTAEKLVNTLVNMVPERDGGDRTEDPHYGIFGAAYLTNAYIHRLGLKGYHFTCSDDRTRTSYSLQTLKRIFGDEVLENVAENGYYPLKVPAEASAVERVDALRRSITSLTLNDVVLDLLRTTHAFYLHIDSTRTPPLEWLNAYGRERVITLHSTEYLPQAQAAIVGLTEGTLNPQTLPDFLKYNGMSGRNATDLIEELRKVPLGEQEKLRQKLEHPLPQAGDVFSEKTDLWPMSDVEAVVREKAAAPTEEGTMTWL